MDTDYNYFKEYKEERIVSLNTIRESAGEDLGRELHRISRTNRSKDRNVIGSYIGLNLSVSSEYSIAGTFDRNLFFIEGVSGVNYRCGQ